MEVALVNVGESPRLFYDKNNRLVQVGVGEVQNADLSSKTLESLRRFAATETLLVMDPEEGAVPEELAAVCRLVTVMNFEEYDKLLTAYNLIVEPASHKDIRPNRQEMRLGLRKKVEEYVRRMARQTIHEEADPGALQRDLDRPAMVEPGAAQPPVHPLKNVQRPPEQKPNVAPPMKAKSGKSSKRR